MLYFSKQPIYDDQTHLQAAIDWLCKAQDVRFNDFDRGGISAGWNFKDGWLRSYPETSGYIIETFIAVSQILNKPSLLDRANRIIDWELSIQEPDGAFPGHHGQPGSKPVIFNTGQIMHGMLAGFKHFKRDECLESAVKAGMWMLLRQDQDGCWRRSVHNDIPHTYNTRAAWALLRTGIESGEKELINGAVNNLRWAMTQQTDSGWFRKNTFLPNEHPFTHTIAYAIRGLLESGLLLDDERMINSAIKAALAISKKQRNDGWLAGTYADNWVPKARYCCLTGVAQMGIIWMRIATMAGNSHLKRNVDLSIQYLKSNHRVTGKIKQQVGGIAGSIPIWGSYSRFEYPNWACKFFSDLLAINISGNTIP